MSNSSEFLNQARRKLIEALGDKKEDYFYHMKQWFRMKITKEEFDSNARDMLPSDLVHYHNEFLLAILTKCQLVLSAPSPFAATEFKTDSSVQENIKVEIQSNLGNVATVVVNTNEKKKVKPKKKTKVARPLPESNFEPVSLQEVVPMANLREPSAISDAGPGYCNRCLHVLDPGPIKGRVLLAAWDHGLTSIGDTVAVIIREASKQCLKNILSAVIKRRKGYRVREGKFVHSIGTVPPNPWIRNSATLQDWNSRSYGFPYGDSGDNDQGPAWPTVDTAEQNAAHLVSCAPPIDAPLPPVSSLDLYITLQTHKSVIPCYTVYALGMERISSRLWHPGYEELEQEQIAKDELRVRAEKRKVF